MAAGGAPVCFLSLKTLCQTLPPQVKLHAGPVTRLAVSYDDNLLVSTGADGAVAVMDVRDKELAKASTRRDQVR